MLPDRFERRKFLKHISVWGEPRYAIYAPFLVASKKIFFNFFFYFCRNLEYMEREGLLERQGWSLGKKIDHSLGVIEDFYAQLDGKVAVYKKIPRLQLWFIKKCFGLEYRNFE